MFRRKEESATESQTSDFYRNQTPNESESNMSGTSFSISTDSTRPANNPEQPVARPAPRPVPASSNDSSNRRPSPASASSSSRPQQQPSRKIERLLTVGPDILLKGEIATCDRLVVEGTVDAKLTNVHTVEVAETGSFKGGAEIQDAIISGLFDGDLNVKNRLVIRSTGRVNGKITYGEIEVERGGQLSGEILHGSSVEDMHGGGYEDDAA